MANQLLPHECLSKEPHDDRVLDVTLHYFGCLEASRREKYFASLPPKSQKRLRDEQLRVRKIRSHFDAHPKTEGWKSLNEFRTNMGIWRRLNRRREPVEERFLSPQGNRVEDEEVENDIKASMIYFNDSRPYDVPGFDNTFPNQKILVKDLLADDEILNPLMQACGDKMIRYFHLPANNMVWIEVSLIHIPMFKIFIKF